MTTSVPTWIEILEFAYRGRSRLAREAGKKALIEHGWLNDAVGQD